jgi:deoxyribodipyrimidine photo-lyase
MGQDWRYGADHFESLLLDYDVGSNFGNWLQAAGLTGGRLNKFNITKQSKDYDEQGEYIKLWCPELSKVPPPLCFEPWKMSERQREEYGVRAGLDYPARIVEQKVYPPRGEEIGNKKKGGQTRVDSFFSRKSNKPFGHR